MQDRLNPLIAERAPWLFRPDPASRAARAAVMRLLNYPETLQLALMLRDLTASEIFARVGEQLAQQVQISGLDHVPRYGPALIVANHPTGVADGIMLHHALRGVRPDMFFYANADILRVFPQLDDVVAPVEWRQNKRSHAKTRATMAYTKTAVEVGRLGVIFPSGRLAKRRGLRLHERPWMTSAAMIARKFDLPVIPVHIEARNSALFYLLDLIHPTLRDVTLFHETLNKDRQPFQIRVGKAISPAALPKSSEQGITLLRRATLGLADQEGAGLSMVRASGTPSWLSGARASLGAMGL